jgi:hypothetical protein
MDSLHPQLPHPFKEKPEVGPDVGMLHVGFPPDGRRRGLEEGEEEVADVIVFLAFRDCFVK